MSHETGSTNIRKFDPENIGEAVGILSLCALKLEAGGIFTPSPLPTNVSKTVAGRGVNWLMCLLVQVARVTAG